MGKFYIDRYVGQTSRFRFLRPLAEVLFVKSLQCVGKHCVGRRFPESASKVHFPKSAACVSFLKALQGIGARRFSSPPLNCVYRAHFVRAAPRDRCLESL